MVKCAAAKVLLVSPEHLAALGRMGTQKSPEKFFAKFLEIDGILGALDVVKSSNKFEIGLRACLDSPFLDGVSNSEKMLQHDAARFRRLPGVVLRQLSELAETADLSDMPGSGKRIKEALGLVPAEDADGSDAICRIDFSTLSTVEGISRLLTGAKLAQNRCDLKRKRVEVEGNRIELSKHVAMTELPDGKRAFTFFGVRAVDVAGDTVVVTPIATEVATENDE